MQHSNLLNRVQGCFMGVMIGDAMGMPVETMSREQILAITDGIGVSCFINPVHRKKWADGLKAGDTTDDWQLTRAVAASIIRTRGIFDITDCAAEHVRELDKSLFGWGKTTQNAIEAIKRGERAVSKNWLPTLPLRVPGKGCGNGVIMKIAPLAIADLFLKKGGSWYNMRQLGAMTHPDIRASIAAFAVAAFIGEAITKGRISTDYCLNFFLLEVINAVKEIKLQEGITTELVSDRLNLIPDNCVSGESLRKAVGSGFYALDTAAFSIGTFIRHPCDFCAGVLEAVNAGGDTDTNASVVGGLIGANCGVEAIPKEWINFNPAFQEALDIGRQFCQ